MKTLIFTVILIVITPIFFSKSVQAVSCNSSSEAVCIDAEVGETAFGNYKCYPKDYSQGANSGSVECSMKQQSSSEDAQLNQWLASSSSGGIAGGVCIPSECNGEGEYVPDLSCQAEKILHPGTPAAKCCENKCKDGSSNTPDPLLEKYRRYGILGIAVNIEEKSIPSLINLALTTFLGIIALYALFRGIYVAGVKRTQATNEEDLAKVNKELTSMVIGFVLAFSFIFIVQLVFNILGLPSLSEFNVNFDGSNPGGPQLVITQGSN